jgi:hypothetical protein
MFNYIHVSELAGSGNELSVMLVAAWQCHQWRQSFVVVLSL